MKLDTVFIVWVMGMIIVLAFVVLPASSHTGICVFTKNGPVDNMAVLHSGTYFGNTDGTGCYSYAVVGSYLGSMIGQKTDFEFTYNGTQYAYDVPQGTVMTVTVK